MERGVEHVVYAARMGPPATGFFARESTRRFKPSKERAPSPNQAKPSECVPIMHRDALRWQWAFARSSDPKRELLLMADPSQPRSRSPDHFCLALLRNHGMV